MKGAAVTGRQVIGAEMTATVDVVAPGLSNALDVRVMTVLVPVSNALDAATLGAASRDRCRWAQERGAPPGAHPHSETHEGRLNRPSAFWEEQK